MRTVSARREGDAVIFWQQGLTLLFASWTVLGVFVDGWAHLNRPGLETFFTPWHALLYSGAAMLFGWLLVQARHGRRSDRQWAIAGTAIFAVGGAGDLLWHEVFGVETGLDALVSPTHLILLTGGLIGLTAPWRENRGSRPSSFVAALPVLGSATLATALAAFFLLYVSPFTTDALTRPLTTIPEGAAGHELAEAPAVAGLGAYLAGTVLVVVPILLLLRSGLLRFGALTLLLTTLATLPAAVTQFDQPAAPAAGLVAGLAADLTVRLTRGLTGSLRSVIVGAAVPLLLWSAQVIALALTVEVRWPPELLFGSLVLSGLLGGTLGLLAGGTRSPVRTTPSVSGPSAHPRLT